MFLTLRLHYKMKVVPGQVMIYAPVPLCDQKKRKECMSKFAHERSMSIVACICCSDLIFVVVSISDLWVPGISFCTFSTGFCLHFSWNSYLQRNFPKRMGHQFLCKTYWIYSMNMVILFWMKGGWLSDASLNIYHFSCETCLKFSFKFWFCYTFFTLHA